MNDNIHYVFTIFVNNIEFFTKHKTEITGITKILKYFMVPIEVPMTFYAPFVFLME